MVTSAAIQKSVAFSYPGWVVALSSLMIHIHTTGVFLAMGVMYVSWIEEFQESRSSTSWVISINGAVLLGLSPLPASLACSHGFRVVTFAGGILTTVGFILSFFATSVAFLTVSIGLITGLGSCFAYLSAVNIISLCFNKRRSLVMGVCASGTGIGAFIAAPGLNYLIETYGWRGAILLTAAISLNLCVYALLLQPRQQQKDMNCANSCSDKSTIENQEGKLLLDESETKSEDEKVSDLFNKNISTGKFIQTSAAVMDTNYSSQRAVSCELANSGIITQSVWRSLDHFENQTNSNISKVKPHLGSLPNNIYFIRNDKEIISNLDFERQDNNLEITLQLNNVGSGRLEKQTILNVLWNTINRNITFLKEPVFLLLAVSNVFTNIAYLTPIMFLLDRAIANGIDKGVGAMLISLSGGGGIVGRLFFGAITYRLLRDNLLVYIIALSLAGSASMLSPLCGGVVLLHCVYAASLGFFLGGYITLVPLVNVDIMGLARASESYALLMSFAGISMLIGPPFAGFLFDRTQSYTLTYIFFGFFLLISGLMLVPLAVIWRKKRRVDTEINLSISN